MKLYEYYEQRKFSPTFANFADEEAFGRYERMRRSLFTAHFHLPTSLFRGASLLEFGPDSGENSLVFARWGAHLTLVEPNTNSHPLIRSYFDRFGLGERLASIESVDLDEFRSDRTFDIIDAEGFIASIQPPERWLGVFASLLRSEGFAVISFCGRLSAFFELLWKVAYHRVAGHLGGPSPEIAWRLFERKWLSVPHTRSFDSWVKDVLENPVIRRSYMMDAGELVPEAEKHGLDLYASWPIVIDPLDVYWHKNAGSERRQMQMPHHLRRSRLSGLFGRKLYMACNESKTLDGITEAIEMLVASADRLVDAHDQAAFSQCRDSLSYIDAVMRREPIVVDQERSLADALDTLGSVRRLLELLERNDVDGAIHLCNNDEPLLTTWGQPAQLAVFQKRYASSAT
jgi:hypothetical protein